MAGVAKWLRQWFVVPPFVGSSPIVRPLFEFNNFICSQAQSLILEAILLETLKISLIFWSVVKPPGTC
jgi:hypothetical protein